jgi:UDP-N-acetylglucosamine 4-epimerase
MSCKNYLTIIYNMTHTILITGGAGFIGSHIADRLLQIPDYKVVIFDNLSTGSMDNIKHNLTNPNFTFVYGDLTNLEQVRKICENINYICHQGGLGSVPRSVDDPLLSHNNNVNGFMNILLAARERNIKRVVYASSSSVYGDIDEILKTENNIGNQLSPYAVTKYVNELYGKLFTKLYGLECIGLRYFNVFGPRQNPHGQYATIIPKFIKALQNNQSVMINGDGNQSRDFTYINNVVDANILALFSSNKMCYGEVFNIGTSNNITVLELYNCVQKYIGTSIEPIYAEPRVGDMIHTKADILKATEHLYYRPSVSFSEGIIWTIEHIMGITNNTICE